MDKTPVQFYKRPLTRSVILFALLGGVAACGLPRSGPSKKEVLASSVERMGDAHIVNVTGQVAKAAAIPSRLSFGTAFTGAGLVGSDDIRAGDVLGLTIWENVDQGLLSTAGQNATRITEVQVDGQGFIFVPYAGRIRAAGQTPEGLRQLITEKLEGQTPDPQVAVTRVAGDGSTVSVMGSVTAQGVYPIDRPTRSLSAMLSHAGGVAIEPAMAKVVLTRAGKSSSVWLTDLWENPKNDVALRPGDKIVVERDRRSFTALGATREQSRVEFETQDLTAIEAIAQVGGLATSLADPTGVFIMRSEQASTANKVLGRSDLTTAQHMIYVLDLTQPSGLFLAREFTIRDGDTVYVTEAPYVQWMKALSALTGSAQSLDSVGQLAGQ